MGEQTVESTFLVTIRATSVASGQVDHVRERQARNLLRALHLLIGTGCHVHEATGTTDPDMFRCGDPLGYDPLSDDMGHHGPDHDTPVIRAGSGTCPIVPAEYDFGRSL